MFSQYEELEIVGTATNGEEALRFLRLVKVDLVISDIDMPIMSGEELLRKMVEDKMQVKVLMMSMHNEISTIKHVTSLGCMGYLLKTSDEEQFLTAIRTVMAGNTYFSGEVTMALIKPKKEVTQTKVDLTSREKEVLRLICEGFSNKEIGEEMFISHRTVDTHRTKMMKKIGVSNVAGLVRFALQNKLIE